MDIQSVTSNASAYTQASTISQTQQNQQAQAVERKEPRPEERVERQEEPPRPVTNAQGQTTGTLINVSA